MANKHYPPAPLTGRDDLGGAVVRRKFSMGGKDTFAGQFLSVAQLLDLPPSNFRALRDNGYLQVFPKPRSGLEAPPEPIPTIEPVAMPKAKAKPRPEVQVNTL